MCTLQLPPKSIVATCNGTSGQFIPLTDWIPAISVKYLKTLLTVIDRTVAFDVIVAYQTATSNPNSPNTFEVFDPTTHDYIDTTGSTVDGLTDISSDTDGVMYIRFGIAVKNSSGTTMQRGQVTLLVTART